MFHLPASLWPRVSSSVRASAGFGRYRRHRDPHVASQWRHSQFAIDGRNSRLVLTLSPSPVTILGNGNNVTLNLLLSGPAPAGGITFTLTSSNPGVVTIPPDVFLSATSSSIGVRLTSVATGSAVIHVNGPGVAEVTTTVTVVGPGAMTLTAPSTMALAQAANLTLTLTSPAPAGGLTVEFASSDSGKVGLSQTSINIPAGAPRPLLLHRCLASMSARRRSPRPRMATPLPRQLS